ncbi:uncharacterized protein ACOB8E_012023 isoform 1-T1 [Sarcophilus harrisii]
MSLFFSWKKCSVWLGHEPILTLSWCTALSVDQCLVSAILVSNFPSNFYQTAIFTFGAQRWEPRTEEVSGDQELGETEQNLETKEKTQEISGGSVADCAHH